MKKIKTLAEAASNELEVLQIANQSLTKQIENLLIKINRLEEENKHLKDKFMSSNSHLIINGADVHSEDMVAELELKRLEDAARTRPLSLEEARIYDIMVRSKKTIKETKQKALDSAKDVTPRPVPLNTLLEAVKVTPEEE
jgi:uncharacterized protein (UPF0335 family)